MPRKKSPLRYVFVRIRADGSAIATGDELPAQTVSAGDDLYGTPVEDLEDGVYQLMPRRLKLTLRSDDLQELAIPHSADPGANEPAPFDWSALCAVVARDLGVPTRQVTRMTLRQVVPKLEDLLYRRGRGGVKRPKSKRHPTNRGTPAEEDLAARLEKTRQRSNHTLDVVAAKVGVDTATVFRWVKRTQAIGAKHRDKVLAYLDDPRKDDE